VHSEAAAQVLNCRQAAADPKQTLKNIRIGSTLTARIFVRRASIILLSFAVFLAAVYILVELDDNLSSFIAGAAYLLTTAVLIWLALTSDKYRVSAISMLGGITPWMLFLLYVSVDFYIQQHEGEDAFAFYAMWIMGLGAFYVPLVVGLALSWVKWPKHLLARYFFALSVVIGLYFLIVPIFD